MHITDDYGNEITNGRQFDRQPPPDDFGNTTAGQREDDFARATDCLAEAEARLRREHDNTKAVMG